MFLNFLLCAVAVVCRLYLAIYKYNVCFIRSVPVRVLFVLFFAWVFTYR